MRTCDLCFEGFHGRCNGKRGCACSVCEQRMTGRARPRYGGKFIPGKDKRADRPDDMIDETLPEKRSY